MKITWSNAGWIVSMGLLIALLLCFLLDNCHSKPEIGVQNDSVQYWKNKNGELVASIKQREQDFGLTAKSYLDSIARLYNTKAKDIKEAVTIAMRGKATIKGSGKTTVVYDPTPDYFDYRLIIDSPDLWEPSKPGGPLKINYPCPPQIKSLSEIFLDPYYTVQATIDKDGDSSFVEIQTYDTLSLVWKEVKEGNFFNRRNYLQVDVKNANQNNVVIGLQAYRAPTPKPNAWNRWMKPALIGAAAGYIGYRIGRK